MFKNNKKALYNNLKKNLVYQQSFYKFSHASQDDDDVYFDGKNPCLLYGFPISVSTGTFFPELTYDIAYMNDGRLYQILTNQEVVIVQKGLNHVKENQILASASISPASLEEVSNFVNLMISHNNIKTYKKINSVK